MKKRSIVFWVLSILCLSLVFCACDGASDSYETEDGIHSDSFSDESEPLESATLADTVTEDDSDHESDNDHNGSATENDGSDTQSTETDGVDSGNESGSEEKDTLETDGTDTCEHEFSDLLAVKSPGCVDKGEGRRTCNKCGAEEVVEIDALGHSYNSTYHSQADGHSLMCDICGEANADGFEAHSVGGFTCNEEYHGYLCAVCNFEYAVEEHKPTTIVINKPDYLNEGYAIYECEVCKLHLGETTLEKLPGVMPEYTIPTVECLYGTRIGDIALPEGFSFDEPELYADEIGEKIFTATYVFPNDTEGKYLTVTGIEITVTVLPIPFEIDCDLSYLEDLTYNGEAVSDPSLDASQKDYLEIRWYSGDEPLESAPVNAGKYSLEIRVSDERYTAETVKVDFIIKKAGRDDPESYISDRGYTGEAVRFDIPEHLTATLTYFDASGNEIDAPKDLGDYFVKIEIGESENYLALSKTIGFSVVVDTEPPVWLEENVQVEIGEKTYTLKARDNGAIDYYHVINISAPIKSFATVTREKVIDLTPGDIYVVVAYDKAGNASSDFYITVSPEVDYVPPKIYPENGAEVNKSYVSLYADWASAYYFGTSDNKEEMAEIEDRFIPSLKSGETYYWYARSGYTESEVFSFTVEYDGIVEPTLISPANGALVSDPSPNLIGTASNGGRIYYAQESSEVYMEYFAHTAVLQDGMTYKWYVEDGDGNRSEEWQFTYFANVGADNEIIRVEVSASNTRFPYVLARAYGITDINYITYYVVHADGTANITYSTSDGFYEAEDGALVTNIRYLQDGDTLYLAAVDEHQVRSKTLVVKVDTEAPVAGDVLEQLDDCVKISVGSDSCGAKYEYRLGGSGEWIAYTGETEVSIDNNSSMIELRAYDAAGNEDYRRVFLGDSEGAPEMTLFTHKSDTVVNQSVSFSFTPAESGVSSYVINGEEHIFDEECSVRLVDEGEYLVYTVLRDGDCVKYSEPVRITVDKTAPVFDEFYYNSERYNINQTYEYICFDGELIEDASDFKLYYSMRGVNDEPKFKDDGRFALYSYYVAESGIYYIDILAVDEAGNSATYTLELFLDVEGPNLDNCGVKYEQDEESGEEKCYIVIEDIVDDFGYYYHMHFQIWDQEGYDNGGESIVNLSFYTEEGEDRFVYDASHLEDGKTYYFLAYATDDLITGNYSLLYYFTKGAPQEE